MVTIIMMALATLTMPIIAVLAKAIANKLGPIVNDLFDSKKKQGNLPVWVPLIAILLLLFLIISI